MEHTVSLVSQDLDHLLSLRNVVVMNKPNIWMAVVKIPLARAVLTAAAMFFCNIFGDKNHFILHRIIPRNVTNNVWKALEGNHDRAMQILFELIQQVENPCSVMIKMSPIRSTPSRRKTNAPTKLRIKDISFLKEQEISGTAQVFHNDVKDPGPESFSFDIDPIYFL